MTSRAHCFTLFQLVEEKEILQQAEQDNQCKYIIFQEEICPKTKKKHYQGYVQWKSPQRMTRVKKLVGNSTHVEKSRGNGSQNELYCSKADGRSRGPWRWGTLTASQGQRTDLESCIQWVKEGKSDLDIYNADPVAYIKFKKYIQTARNMELQQSTAAFRAVSVLVYYGDAGAGKTRLAMELDPDLYIVPDPEGGKLWFDGYNGQETILLDDFYGWIKYHFLLRILDGYRIQLQTKGGFCQGAWKRVIITSNKHPNEWYSFGYPDALKRRIEKVTHVMANSPFSG